MGGQDLYFLPDAILIEAARAVTALPYNELSVSLDETRFIESGAIPKDASVVGHTWKYVNKKGGPDRRFNFNKQLPVCLYGELAFVSSTGLNGLIQLSNPNAGERFVRVLEVLHGIDASIFQSKSIKSFKRASAGPSLLFWLLFLSGAVGIGLFLLHGSSNAMGPIKSIVSTEQKTTPVEKFTSVAPPHVEERPKAKRSEQSVRQPPVVGPPLQLSPETIANRSNAVIPLPRPRP
jgi:hypothetical protein